MPGWAWTVFAAWVAVSVLIARFIGRAIALGSTRDEQEGGRPMPAIPWDLAVEAGSYEPQYIVLRDPETGDLLDLTATGYAVHGVVATRPDGLGTVLVDLDDASVWRRTEEGRIYFEPTSTTSSTWTFRHGYHQVELTHPSGNTVRIATGRMRVSPELVTD